MRKQGRLQPLATMRGWHSPRLNIRFEMPEQELELYYADGRRFLTFVELEQARVQEAQARAQAEVRAEKAEATVQELQAKLRQAGLL